jgi:hypothetical protein
MKPTNFSEVTMFGSRRRFVRASCTLLIGSAIPLVLAANAFAGGSSWGG